MKRILAIIPFVLDREVAAAHAEALNNVASAGTLITAVPLTSGPTPADYDRPDFVHATREVAEILESCQSDFDAAFISCFEDPGLEEARAIARIPVTGPLEATMGLVRALGEDFFLVSPDHESEPGYRHAIGKLGAGHHFNAFETVDFEVGNADVHADAVNRIAAAILQGRTDRPNDLAILACTDFLRLHADVKRMVGGRVIEPATVAVRTLEFVLDRKIKIF